MAKATPSRFSASSPSTDDGTPVPNAGMEFTSSPETTPSKKHNKPVAESDDEEDRTPNKKSNKKNPTSEKTRKRKSNKTPNRGLPMANSYELSAEHDKMLIDMRDAGASWEDIRKAWEKMTGDKTAYSTLPNRYSRLMSNFVVIKEQDNPVLLECHHLVETRFEKEKWAQVAEMMEEKGTEAYKPEALYRQYKKLMLFSKDLEADFGGKKTGGGEEEEEEEEMETEE